jgi:hypothetical protein
MGFSTKSKSLLINASLSLENSSEMLIIFRLLGLRQSSGPKNEIEGGSFLHRGSMVSEVRVRKVESAESEMLKETMVTMNWCVITQKKRSFVISR